MSARLILDSTTDLPASLQGRLHTVPLTVLFGEEEYIDGVTINHHQFYEKLVSSEVTPRTSQPTPEAFAAEYRSAKEAGEDVVVLTISSKLSGTCQSATIAAQGFDNVYVVDSMNVAIGAGVLAEYAVRLIEQGLSAQEVADRLVAERGKVRLIASLDTLEYLRRGGRISRTEAFAGTLLSIKPVIGIVDGEVATLGKARGAKQAGNLLMKELQREGVNFDRPVLLGYTGLSDAALQKFIQDSADLWTDYGVDVPATIVGSVVGTHAGPGAVAVGYFAK